ncbi:PHD finger protein 21A-like isoform X2 [Periplaneta americana]|uniref:PHD finger protein 21A-like isoform X2 n=1 Tax=Periplaneta americana TaxID=6978 RepID=UPI0037E9B2D5
MEVSKPLQADIRHIQNQLKIAIQNHQIVVLKMRDDPTNVQMKKQLLSVQKHILLLGENQKRLVQRLRKELEANATNSTLNVKSVALSLGINNISNNNNNTSNNNIVRERCTPVRPSSVSSTSSSTTSEDSEDSQRDRDDVVAKCCNGGGGKDPSLATKLQFMNAVGLVTREVLSELQNRRVERKRRSTANHTQFVYGSSWDFSKRKKSSYLTSSAPPSTRQLTRSLRTEPTEEVKPPLSSGENGTDSVASQQKTVLSQQTSGSLALRIPGLPASLTIERIQATVCIVCRKPGSLSTCSSCSTEYHTACAAECGRCPKCSLKQEKDSVDIKVAEREAEKQRLVSHNGQLNAEKDALEKRAAELSAALVAQTTNRKELLHQEEMTRKSIQRIHDFVTIIKSAPSPPPPS